MLSVNGRKRDRFRPIRLSVEDTVGKGSAAFEIIGIITNDVGDHMQDAQKSRLPKLRHVDHMTPAVVTNLGDKLGQRGSMREVEDSVRL